MNQVLLLVEDNLSDEKLTVSAFKTLGVFWLMVNHKVPSSPGPR